MGNFLVRVAGGASIRLHKNGPTRRSKTENNYIGSSASIRSRNSAVDKAKTSWLRDQQKKFCLVSLVVIFMRPR
jgi:hypothetical protein